MADLSFFILLVCLPLIFLILSTKLLYEGLRDLQLIYWGKIYKACGWLFLICICLILEIAMGLSFGVVFVFIFMSIAAFVSGLYLLSELQRWRKLAGLFIGIGLPVIMFMSSTTIGMHFDPDAIIKRNGTSIAAALNEYYIDKGNYPEKLGNLVPTYIDDLKDPGTMWGWLYVSDKDDFTLGYVDYIDWRGYSICKYSAAIPEWNCGDDSNLYRSTEPFHLEPTPSPEPVNP